MALQEELKTQGDFLFRNRSYLPLIVLVIGLGVYISTKYYEIDSATETGFTESYELICLGVCLLGLLIRIITVGHSPKNTSGRNTKEGQIADVLNTTGMYSVVRHPLYVGNFFMWLGVGTRRLELPRPKRSLAPQASASTNSATCANCEDVMTKIKKVKQ